MLDRLSLKARLLLGVIVLSAIGLGAAAVPVRLPPLLVSSRPDRRVARDALSSAAEFEESQAASARESGRRRASAGDFFQIRGTEERVLCTRQVAEITAAERRRRPSCGRPRRAELVHGGVGGRREPLPRPGRADGLRTDRRRHLARRRGRDAPPLARHVLLVTVAVLAALAALALWSGQGRPAPLDEIETTAAAIATGDLSRRVERAEPGTEVGRLQLALNAMLGQIERAFEAERASEQQQLRRFVADASHEHRTPALRSSGLCGALRARVPRRGPTTSRAPCAGSSTRIRADDALVEDLLLLARLDEGRPLEQEPVRLDAVVGEAVETAQAVEPARPIELHAEPAAVVGDRDRLRQIVDNLLANARAHASPTPVAVRSRPRTEIRSSRSPTGPGIEAGDAERIFRRFYRTDSSRSREAVAASASASRSSPRLQRPTAPVAAESPPGQRRDLQITLPLADGDEGS